MENIILYSSNNCPWCVKAKRYLKQRDIKFEEKNVNLDSRAAEEMIIKSGQRGIPVIDIKGEIVVGFDKVRIDNLLEGFDKVKIDSLLEG